MINNLAETSQIPTSIELRNLLSFFSAWSQWGCSCMSNEGVYWVEPSGKRANIFFCSFVSMWAKKSDSLFPAHVNRYKIPFLPQWFAEFGFGVGKFPSQIPTKAENCLIVATFATHHRLPSSKPFSIQSISLLRPFLAKKRDGSASQICLKLLHFCWFCSFNKVCFFNTLRRRLFSIHWFWHPECIYSVKKNSTTRIN